VRPDDPTRSCIVRLDLDESIRRGPELAEGRASAPVTLGDGTAVFVEASALRAVDSGLASSELAHMINVPPGERRVEIAHVLLAGVDDPSVGWDGASPARRPRVRCTFEPVRSMLAAALCALTACQADTLGICARETFESIDEARWEYVGVEETTVSANGRLVIALPAATNTNQGLVGLFAEDLTGGFVSVEIARYLTESASTQSELVVRRDPDNYFFIGAAGPQLILRLRTAGVDRDVTAPLDRAVRFWRVRHDAGTDVIEYQTSVDGKTWATARSEPSPFALDGLDVQLEADAYNGGGAAADSAEFDNLVFASPSCAGGGHELGPHL
jgi:hypothetical protein